MLLTISVLLSGCFTARRRDRVIRQLSDFYSEDTFTFVDSQSIDSFGSREILTLSSELFPDDPVTVSDASGVVQSNYERLLHKEAVSVFFADLTDGHFECDMVRTVWNEGRSGSYPLERLSDEEFIERYITYNFSVFLYYDEYPDQDRITEDLMGLARELDTEGRIIVNYLSTEQEDLSIYDASPDLKYTVVTDDAGEVSYIERTEYVTVLQDYDI